VNRILTAILLATVAASARGGELEVVPLPREVTRGAGEFDITPATRVFAEGAAATAVAEQLAGYLAPAMGRRLEVSRRQDANGGIGIDAACTDGPVARLGREGYYLSISPERVTVLAMSAAGAFYGVQTIRQLLPADIFSPTKVEGVRWALPAVTIYDSPRFGWRGLMTDVSRHFLNVDTVKRYLDLMALHKLNVFHWHLVDGHGQRLEIRAYPRLTSFGGFRRQPPIGRHGGFYTQDEVRDIVRYAAERHITIVPEIEMPGHSRAATAALPFLACQDNGVEVGYFFAYPCPAKSFPKLGGSNVLCAGRETTFEFLEAVLKETFELFPSEFIHVGGDEVGKGFWKKCPDCQARMEKEGIRGLGHLQSYFMKRVEKFINANGRRMIGWDEILEGGLAPNATVMSWRGEGGGIKAAKMGHDVVMTPQKPLHFDHGQTKARGQPKHWPGTETLEEVYLYNPVPEALTPEQGSRVLGCQGNVWGAFVHSDEVLDCQTWPRGCALSETAWTPTARKDLAAFKERLGVHLRRLDLLNVSYWREPEGGGAETGLTWTPQQTPREFARRSWTLGTDLDPASTYSVEFRYTRGRHGLDVKSVALESGDVRLADGREGFTGSRSRANVWTFVTPAERADQPWTLSAEIQGSAGTDSTGVISVTKGTVGWRRPRVVPGIVTTRPVTHNRDRRIYDWPTRHREIIERNRNVKPDIIFLGDSITHYWAGEPTAPKSWGAAAWASLFAGYTVTNMGCGWDRTENVLWRLRNGELDGISPKLAIVLIGTNNLAVRNTPREIYWGVQAIVDEVHSRCPAARVLVVGLLPRKSRFASTPERVNNLLATLNDRPYVRFFNVNYSLVDEDGRRRGDLYGDGVHVNAGGYAAIAEALRPVVGELMK
jgi:hexosaminidase